MEANLKLRREYLLPGAVLLIIFVVGLTFLRQTISGIFSAREGNKETEAQLLVLENKIQQLFALDSEKLSQQVELVERIYPSKKPVLNLIAALNILSEESGVNFKGIELTPDLVSGQPAAGQTASQGGKQESFPISFKIVGKLDNILSFMKSLERSSPVIKIEGLELSSGETGTTQEPSEIQRGEAVMVTFSVVVYYQELPESLGKIDEPLAQLSPESSEILDTLEEFKVFKEVKTTAPTGRENPFTL